MVLSVKDSRQRWRCSETNCHGNNDILLRANSWLDISKLPYLKMFLFLYSWSFESTSVAICERGELDINHNTTVDRNNYLRELYASKILNNPRVKGGPG